MANEIRRRPDFVAGGLSADMASGATSMSSAGLADLPAIGSTEHAAVTLWRTDVAGRVTLKEIVWVTAHTGSATSATVVRGREGTTAQNWVTGDRWSVSQLSSDAPVICTSGARPSNPYTGMLIFETDTGKLYQYNGTTWDLPRNVAAGALTVPDANAFNANARALSKSASEAVAGTSVAVATLANRRYRIDAKITTASGGAWSFCELRLRRGTTVAGTQIAYDLYSRPTSYSTMRSTAWDVPGAQASQQWVLTHTLDSSVCDLFNPCYVVVTDVGAA